MGDGPTCAGRVWAQQRVSTTVQDQAGVGIQSLVPLMDRAIGRSMSQGARRKGSTRSRERLGYPTYEVSPLTSLLEYGILGSDLSPNIIGSSYLRWGL